MQSSKQEPTSTYDHTSQSFAWRAADFESSTDFSVSLTEVEQDRLYAAIRRWDDGSRSKPVHELVRADNDLDEAFTAKLCSA
ncbi:MAG: hypothetical protein H0T52_12285, partial [Lautropia sp.]|nr:hypothetical protein [Lautropia sp.]